MKINLTVAKTIAEQDTLPMLGNRAITAEWTGRWPNLCSGEWIITIDGEKVDLPDEVRTSPMGTYGTYNTWTFGENWSVEWSTYEDGLDFEPWLQENRSWVSKLNLSDTEERDLYDAISEEDWRHNSCGGCI